jgi:hypothetical protein
VKLGDDRLGSMSFNARRAIVALTLLPFLLAVVNLYFDWHWFGSFDKGIVLVCAVALFLVLRYLGPTVRDAQEHRIAKRMSKQR